MIWFHEFPNGLLLIRLYVGEYGNQIVIVFLSLNNHSGMVNSSFSFLIVLIVSLIDFNGKPAYKYLSSIF